MQWSKHIIEAVKEGPSHINLDASVWEGGQSEAKVIFLVLLARLLVSKLHQCDQTIQALKTRPYIPCVWNLKHRIELYPFELGHQFGICQKPVILQVNDMLEKRKELLVALGTVYEISKKEIDNHRVQLSTQIQMAHSPLVVDNRSFLQRNWLNISAASVAVIAAGHMLLNADHEAIHVWFEAIHIALSNLVQKWIVKPLNEIWDTVRYSKSNIRLTNEQTVRHEADALRRMIDEYASQSTLDNSSVESNFELVLRDYETSIKSPIKSAFFGHLLRLILIQVQNGKVDIGYAMLTMEKLMRANELNFEMVAIFPITVLMYAVYWKASKKFEYLRGYSRKQLITSFKTCLLRISNIFPFTIEGEAEISGQLVYECFNLTQFWQSLGHSEEENESFAIDLGVLLNSDATIEDKRWTILKMHNFYSFK